MLYSCLCRYNLVQSNPQLSCFQADIVQNVKMRWLDIKEKDEVMGEENKIINITQIKIKASLCFYYTDKNIGKICF